MASLSDRRRAPSLGGITEGFDGNWGESFSGGSYAGGAEK